MGRFHQWRWGSAIQSCVDGEASATRVALVERHVADCPDCAGDMEFFRQMRAVFGRLRDSADTDPAVVRLRAVATRISA